MWEAGYVLCSFRGMYLYALHDCLQLPSTITFYHHFLLRLFFPSTTHRLHLKPMLNTEAADTDHTLMP